MAQSFAKFYAQTAHSECSSFKRAAFSVGLLKTDPRETSKILGKNIPQESSEFGMRIVALSPTLLKRLSRGISEEGNNFSMRASSGFCYIYNTNSIGNNLVLKINDARFTTAHFIFHKKDGSSFVVTKRLGNSGAGQKVARAGLDENMKDTRFLEIYIGINPNNS